MQRSKKNKNSKSRRGAASNQASASRIPRWNSSLQYSRVMRWGSNNTGGYTFKRSDFLDCQLMATGAAVGYRLCSAVRINRVRIWGPPPGNAPETISLEWFSEYSPAKVMTDTSMGTVRAAYVESKPPRNSLASFWMLQGSNETVDMLSINLTTGTLVEFSLTCMLQNAYNNKGPVVTTAALAGMSLGTVYAMYLDARVNGAGSTLQPVATTFAL